MRETNKKKIESERTSGHSQFRFIDLFAGIGGMRRAFAAQGGECVFSSEWNPFAQITYQANFGEMPAGDIRNIEASSIPDHEILLAGFPCQPFSLAGVSKKNSLGREHGFKDKTQGTLFFDVARILDKKRPAAFLLENVKNLRSHDGGKTLKVIKEILEGELKYKVFDKVLDARYWVPQHRERIYIVGFDPERVPDCDTFEFPGYPNAQPKLSEILHLDVPEKYTLTPGLWKYLKAYAAKHRAAGNGFGYGLFGPDGVARTLSARYYKDGSEILIRTNKRRPRRLTPRECAALMGYDPDVKIPVSDTQAYKQFGNSVVVPVVKAIAKKMMLVLGSRRPAARVPREELLMA